MNEKDIEYLEMAKSCGLYGSASFKDDLLEFAYSIAKAEREACAKLLDDMAAHDHYTNYYVVGARAVRAGRVE